MLGGWAAAGGCARLGRVCSAKAESTSSKSESWPWSSLTNPSTWFAPLPSSRRMISSLLSSAPSHSLALPSLMTLRVFAAAGCCGSLAARCCGGLAAVRMTCRVVPTTGVTTALQGGKAAQPISSKSHKSNSQWLSAPCLIDSPMGVSMSTTSHKVSQCAFCRPCWSMERHTRSEICSPGDAGAADSGSAAILRKVGRMGLRNMRLMWNHQVAGPVLTLKKMNPFKMDLRRGKPWAEVLAVLNRRLLLTRLNHISS